MIAGSAFIAIFTNAAFRGFHITIIAFAGGFATRIEIMVTEFTGVTLRTISAFG